ncbi:MAG: hypothetical protein QOD89_2304 [Bradyrhizobium sp.]|nr:hypothetical protein [Bradyrhizobium sp.]
MADSLTFPIWTGALVVGGKVIGLGGGAGDLRMVRAHTPHA